jgi:putative membrane-bound dehydrogenase-like protein
MLMRSLKLVLALVPALALLAMSQARPQGFSPTDAVRRMQVPAGFVAQLVAAEPLVRQPVAIEFDDRGRLWVVQYLQYPNPAGLRRVKVDRYSRTVYDRVPEPPPRGPRGADRITILSAVDAQGQAHAAKEFVSGLNLASGIAFGYGGIFVLQAPYLLFYPDKNGDDVPDGDPEVLLSGFGMEDASAVGNSLTWGPDGWLYGCQGSTVTAHVRGVTFQQGVWRYHPRTRRFELFADGGGNAWGLDFDAHGTLFYSTNYGGYVAVHGVQGGYYWKDFGKHGPLSNPYTYGYLGHIPHQDFHGGHVTVGGIIYQGGAFPERFRGTLIAGDLLGHAVYWHHLEPAGSTYHSRHGGELLLANDTWFAPTDLTVGPDGAVYVADWYDQRTAHPDPDAEWDRSNGRVYRIKWAAGSEQWAVPELGKLSSTQLVALLDHPNDWFVRRARRLLAERRDSTIVPLLRERYRTASDGAHALQALWALYASGGFEEDFARLALRHPDPYVRAWTVRLLGDEGDVTPVTAACLEDLAANESALPVRGQLACTARRLPPALGLSLAFRVATAAKADRDADARDAYLPLLLWWAVERHALAGRTQTLSLFTSPAAWQTPVVQKTILERLVRRYAAEGAEAGCDACAQLLASAPSAALRRPLVDALDLGIKERPKHQHPELLSPALRRRLAGLWADAPADVALLRLLTRLGWDQAEGRVLTLVKDRTTPVDTRQALLQLLAEAGSSSCADVLLKLLDGSEPEAIQLAALHTLGRFDQDKTASALLRSYPRMSVRLRAGARTLLLGRKRWALAFLEAVDYGVCRADEVTLADLRPVALYKDARLDDLVRKHWGAVHAATPEEKLAEVRRLNNDVRAGPGDAQNGRQLFRQHCATCHRLFGEGESLGPDLTHANRKDRDYLLVSLIDPSAMIRKEYLSYVVETTDGRLLTGLLVEQTAGSVTLADAKNSRTVMPRDRIARLTESPVSLMPEDLIKQLRPQELRDLFAYLQGDAPVGSGKPAASGRSP